ncbi:MAG: glycosyltransferase [Oscillospiraceae bacterium]|nr:glycosyltransferase [Oscillospiraceae bacterium]
MLAKLNNLLKKHGAGGTVSLLARYVLRSAEAVLGPGKEERAAVSALLGEIRAGEYERLVLRRGSFGWHTPLFQRAQQLARAMGRCGCLVLYEAAPPHDRLRGAERLGEGLWLVNLRSPRLRRRLEKAAKESGRPRYLMLASPESRLPARLPGRYARGGWALLYDYIDALSAEIGGGTRVPRRTLSLYDWAMKREDVLVAASSLALLEDARRRGKRALLVENGVDCAHFFTPAPCPADGRFRALLDAGRPIVCFYGALARWLDYEALRAVAADGRFTLLLIGVKYDESFERELAGRERVVFLGPRPYEMLPGYAARCDVLLVPFRKSPVSDAASPVKLFEYMALGKPIVAGDSAECRRFRSVLIAKDAREFIPRIEQALALRCDASYWETERAEALSADWLRRAEKLCGALRGREEREKT